MKCDYFIFVTDGIKLTKVKRRTMQRVLVVEDSKVVQQVLRHLTAQYLDVAIDFAWSLAECKSYVEKHDYSLALVDLTLPDAPHGEVAQYTLTKKSPQLCLRLKLTNTNASKCLNLVLLIT
jgi:CheY-like chemotaxis protein